jgi:hypothetical protein
MRLSWPLFALLASMACKTAPAPAPVPPARPSGPPDAFEAIADSQAPQLAALLRREAPALPLLPFQSPQGAFSGHVPAKAAPSLSVDEGGQLLTVPFGEASPIHCFFRPERLDAGNSIQRTVTSAMGKELEVAYLRPGVDATSRGPVLSADLVYIATRNGQRLLGEYKVAVAVRDSLTVLCAHDETGYRKSFHRAVLELVESLHGGESSEAPEGSELWLSHLGAQAVGYEELSWKRDDKGKLVERAVFTILASPDSKVLHSADRFAYEDSSKGIIQSQVVVSAIDGAIKFQATLSRNDKGYDVRGRKGESPLDTGFESAGLTSCEPWRDPRVADLRAGKIEEFSIDAWIPDAFLEGITQRTVKRGLSPGSLEVGGGKATAVVEFDEKGAPRRSEGPLAGGTLVSELAWRHGATYPCP